MAKQDENSLVPKKGAREKNKKTKIKKKPMDAKVIDGQNFAILKGPAVELDPPTRVRATLASMTGRPMDQILPNTKIDSLPKLNNLASTMTVVVRIYRQNAKGLVTADFDDSGTVQDIIDVVVARIASDAKP